jgi:hypothetical protein
MPDVLRAVYRYVIQDPRDTSRSGAFQRSPIIHGLAESSIPAIVAGSRGSSRKTNPIAPTDDEIAGILQASL